MTSQHLLTLLGTAGLAVAAACTSPDTQAPPATAAPATPRSVVRGPSGAERPPASATTEVLPPLEQGPDTPAEDAPDEHETVYVVIADTGRQYRPLLGQLRRLHAASGLRIDSLGRFYDPQKNLIRLPDTAPPGEEKTFDDNYAGDYYPRRGPNTFLSVEYTDLYTRGGPKSMALVAGIYEQPAHADSLLRVVRRTVPGAFRVKTSMYMGCLH